VSRANLPGPFSVVREESAELTCQLPGGNGHSGYCAGWLITGDADSQSVGQFVLAAT